MPPSSLTVSPTSSGSPSAPAYSRSTRWGRRLTVAAPARAFGGACRTRGSRVRPPPPLALAVPRATARLGARPRPCPPPSQVELDVRDGKRAGGSGGGLPMQAPAVQQIQMGGRPQQAYAVQGGPGWLSWRSAEHAHNAAPFSRATRALRRWYRRRRCCGGLCRSLAIPTARVPTLPRTPRVRRRACGVPAGTAVHVPLSLGSPSDRPAAVGANRGVEPLLARRTQAVPAHALLGT